MSRKKKFPRIYVMATCHWQDAHFEKDEDGQKHDGVGPLLKSLSQDCNIISVNNIINMFISYKFKITHVWEARCSVPVV